MPTEKELTAMQVHIKEMKEAFELCKSMDISENTKITFEGCIENAEDKLDLERKQIIDARFTAPPGKGFINYLDEATDYFTNKYKQ